MPVRSVRKVLLCSIAILSVANAAPALAARAVVMPDSSDSSMTAPSSQTTPTPPAGLPVEDTATPALPAGGALPAAEASPRSPGMQLPADEDAANSNSGGAANPFAPPKEVIKSPEEVESDIRNQAFGAAMTGLLPLRPVEIRKLLEHFDETRQAVETPIYPYPTPEVTAQTVSLDPGVAPPEIKVAVGHVTTLALLDSTGAPWPIEDMVWAGNFQIVKPTTATNVTADDPDNIIRITPLSEFTYGNISIHLIKQKTPVTFILRTHRDKVDFRFDARVTGRGPFAKVALMQGGGSPVLVAGDDSTENAILDGIPPAGAAKMWVTGVDSRTSAYKLNQTTYVRTPLTLLSPGWSSSVSSADGTNVYVVTNAPVLLLSDQGAMVQARLSDHDPTEKDVAAGSSSTANTSADKDTNK